MSEIDDRLEVINEHMTPMQLATHMRFSGVGKKYERNHQLWNENNDIRIVGLLELILNKLESLEERQLDEVELDVVINEHGRFLRLYCEEVMHVESAYLMQALRLCKLMDCKPEELYLVPHELTVEYLSNLFRQVGAHRCELKLAEFRRQVKAMEKVETPNDIDLLIGVGKATKAKLLKRLNGGKNAKK